MSRPFFAEVRRREQVVDNLAVAGLVIGRVHELANLRGRRWQPDEVEIQSPDQAPAIGAMSRNEADLGKSSAYEAVDFI